MVAGLVSKPTTYACGKMPMPRLDKSDIKSGMFITGDTYRAELMSSAAATAPVIYGQPVMRQIEDLSEIGKRLDAAKRRLDEIAAAVRRQRR